MAFRILRNTGLVLVLLFAVSCGSTQDRLDEALTSVKTLTDDAAQTSKSIREDLVPKVGDAMKTISVSTYQIQLLALAIQSVLVNLEPMIAEFKDSVIITLEEVRGLFRGMRELKTQIQSEISKTSEMRDRLSDHGRELTAVVYTGIVLAGVLIVLFIVMIHHKISANKRHEKQLEHMLENGGSQKILKALKQLKKQVGED